ncbi:MAG: asparagine synthase (glutamine-hydrolyzing) [Gammaproteobacteria bacterium RIFCSPHIGHO2_12_FULL_36_30]|nr:MAG: asparagine synthase (glutamine-hydrolyzing) [Gammaproteobacteria bacterium RIFCSPHIGHO2_12_FULL_36_30]
MCAITGIISNIFEYNQSRFLNPILSAMHHRGPDATAQETFNHAGCFGHNRLSIIDLNERATQPMWDASHRYCLTFNGEIYNYLLIKKELIQSGHFFRTESDSEVLIEAWAEWGINAIEKLVGMFAFAVWDNHLKHLFLVRDRMGEKPLFYAPINKNFKNGLVFASELKGLTRYPFIEKKLSMTALNHYISFNYTSTNDCIFEGIYKLPPASYLFYNLNTHEYKISQYWILENYFKNKKIISAPDAQDQLNSLLKNSVAEQSIADVPLGAFLSGGIDSSSIVANMSHNNANQVNTFSIGFKEKTYSELENSQKVADYLSVKHHAEILFPNISNQLSKIVCAFDEPFADTSMIPTYLLSKFSKEFVKVSLSGDGGDELFGGYITYQADRYHQIFKYLPTTAKKLLMSLINYLPTSFNKISLDYKAKQFLRGSFLTAQQAHLSWREIFNAQQKNKLFKSEFHLNNFNNSNLDWFNNVSDCHYLDQAMYVDMKTWLTDDILVKVDQASMAHSLEVRAPFLDHRLVEFAASLPVSYKLNKKILKNSQNKTLPAFVLQQSKKGFNSPVSHWLKNDLFSMAYDITTSRNLTNFFDKMAIEKLWLEHQNSVCDNGYRLFNLLCLGLWLQGRHV